MKMRPRGRSASTSGPSSAATQATSRQAAAGRAPAQRDGGRTALGGYLHQMVVAWGLTAWAETLEERRDGTELDALVEVMRTGTSLHEAFDEDLAIGLDRFGLDPDTIGALVQIKYSRARHPRTLNAHDIEDIVQSFRRSIRRARNAGRSISRLVILSNRRLARPRRVADPSGKSAGTVRLPTEVENIPLSFITGIPDHLWREKLEAFARRYGCFDEEVLAGIQRLVGDLLDTAVHDPAQPIRRERLETALAGFPSPRPLTSTSIVEEPDEVALANLLEGTLWLPPSPVRRDVLDALDECTDHRALILITGFGGMGKTVALWQWIQTQRERMRHGDPIVATMRLGQFVDENYLASLARKWANDVTRASGRGLSPGSSVL